jgi:mannosyltransferase OCH1-like enzyme
MEFLQIYYDNFEFDYNKENKESKDVNQIPRIIHLIWVGDNPKPNYLLDNLNKWKELMPSWDIKLWTNNDISTKHFPLNIIKLLNKVNKGAQKADIMRYYIMAKYGGFYLDSDVTPYRSLEPLITQLPNINAILCHDFELTWAYISIGFFSAIPNHPIFIKACELVNNALIY